jgi:hypothetical protein
MQRWSMTILPPHPRRLHSVRRPSFPFRLSSTFFLVRQSNSGWYVVCDDPSGLLHGPTDASNSACDAWIHHLASYRCQGLS